MPVQRSCALLIAALSLVACTKQPPPPAPPPAPVAQTAAPATLENPDATIEDLQAALKEGKVTSRALVDGYLARIEKHDPTLKAIISLNPKAREDADRLDRERNNGQFRGPLHGIPIVIKDNIDFATAGMPNTAGSLALSKNVPAKDAPVVAKLIDAGAIILAKANLSEWANIRSDYSSSGWSAIGGLARYPYATDR
jgi:amidase